MISDVYGLIAAEADRGRTFIWYTTETEELFECDRVYVFREAKVVAEVHAGDITEDRILQSSF